MNAAVAPEPVVAGDVLLGADELVATFVSRHIPGHAGFERYKAVGVLRKLAGRPTLIGGVVYHNWRGHDCEVSSAMLDGRWARRGVLRALFNFPFNQLGCSRLTAITSAENADARKALVDQGFAQEGLHRRGWHDGISDAVSYGMLREDCIWIRG